MQLLILMERRFRRTPDGTIWTDGPSFCQQYLGVFDRLEVLARVRDVNAPPDGWSRAGGEGIEFRTIPHYIGPKEYLSRRSKVREAIDHAYRREAAVIMRLPSFLSPHLTKRLEANGHPYGVEVVGDPADVFAPGVIQHPLRPLLRWWMPRLLRKQCARASAARYVTERALQRRYACPSHMTGASDVDLPVEAFRSRPELHRYGRHVVTIASMEQPYKGIQHLLDAVARCVRMGLDLQLTIIGRGRLQAEFERQSESLGLRARVAFRGALPAGAPVRAILDSADLFVLPSLTEGLPRAMVEAMARSVPCIGTAVGGIPELLAAENLVPPGDVASLAAKIGEVLGNPARMAKMSAENLVKASAFEVSALYGRRIAFYRHLQKVTQAWTEASSRRHAKVKYSGAA